MSLPELCLGLAPLVFLLRCPGKPRWHIHAAQGHSRGMPSQGNLPDWLWGTGAWGRHARQELKLLGQPLRWHFGASIFHPVIGPGVCREVSGIDLRQ